MQARVGVLRWQDKQSLVLGVVPRLPRREAGSLPCLGPRLNAWVGKEGRGFGVWSPGFPIPGPVGREGPLKLAARWADSDLLPPYLLLPRGHARPGEACWGEGRLLCRSDLGLGGWSPNRASTAMSQD